MKGTFYVTKVGKNSWRVMVRTYGDAGTTQTVPRTAWSELGFSKSMTIEQARSRAKQLNALATVDRKQASQTVRIAARIEQDHLYHSAFIPQEINHRFLKWLDENVSGNETTRLKTRSRWKTVKDMIIALELKADEFAENRKKIYRYMARETYSLDSTKKLLRVLNLYGRFVARLSGKFYEPVVGPRGHDRQMINDAYLDSDSYYGPSEPLTPELLVDLKRHLKPEQHDWLKITLWFGLRPEEADAIIADRDNKVWRVDPKPDGKDVLWVYQPKLTSLPRHKRWKPIQIEHNEQKDALALIYEGKAIAPLNKTLKKHSGMQLTLRCGRKGFTDLMLDLGHTLDKVATWLGHTSINMTWAHYKDRQHIGASKIKKS